MSGKTFGKLVKALREESRIRHPDEHRISQDGLAKQILSMSSDKLDNKDVQRMANTLARIEQGQKKYIDSTLLDSLATVFELTSKEREQFFLAATRIQSRQRTNQNIPPLANILEDLEKLLARIQSPAMVVDFHGDIVMFNYAMLRMYGQDMNILSQTPIYNLLLLLFELSHSVVRENHYKERLIQNIRFIRTSSLPHRNDEYFVCLLDYMTRRYRQFSPFWQMAYTHEDLFTLSTVYDHHHDDFGQLNYMNSVSTIMTKLGTLSLLTYVPLSVDTNRAFLNLAHETSVARVPDWPGYKQRSKELFG